MKFINFLFTTILVLFFCSCMNESQTFIPSKKQVIESYPESNRDSSIVEDYHGTSIADPYRWLEDDHSDETKDWVTRQNDTTFDYLDNIPFKSKVKERLTDLWNYERYSSPFKRGDKYYFFKNDGLQNQSVLYSIDDLSGDGEVVIDPNSFSEDGTTSLGGFSFNKNGTLLAYTISEGGSDWRTAQVLDLKTMKPLNDEINWVKFSGLSWQGDGFYYSRYPEPNEEDELSGKNEYHQVYYHKIGSAQKDDKLIYDQPDHPLRNVFAQTTDDERFLILGTSESTSGNAMSFKDLSKPNSPIVNVVSSFDNDYSVVDNDGDYLFVLTNRDAKNQRLIKIDSKNPSSSNWEEIIPEAQQKLQWVTAAGDKLFASYLKDAYSLVKVFDRNGSFIQNLSLPGIGSIGGITGKEESDLAFYSYTSFTYPTTIFKLDTKTLESDIFRQPTVDFDPEQFMTEQKWFESYDGTRVPLFVTHNKKLKLNGDNPTLLYAYGGFDISVTPSFNPGRVPLLENGGVYAVANIRGGGEFGKSWHEAGTKERKQNVFDDFQSAAEYLIKEKYTSSEKLAIQGGSNGGLLVGACITQRPDLYAVAFPAVGVLDMLRYHKFTIGWAWASDYGSSDEPDAFEYLLKYSPLHNVKEAEYPATLVTTADHDDRVVPAHSFKFISELQHNHIGENPVLIRVETSAGHGAGKPTSKRIEEYADVLSFMFYNMNETMNFELKG